MVVDGQSTVGVVANNCLGGCQKATRGIRPTRRQRKTTWEDSVKSAVGILTIYFIVMGAAISIAACCEFQKGTLVRPWPRGRGSEGVATAFSKIATQSDLQGLRNQVKGTVTDLQLMKMAVSANTLGLPVNFSTFLTPNG